MNYDNILGQSQNSPHLWSTKLEIEIINEVLPPLCLMMIVEHTEMRTLLYVSKASKKFSSTKSIIVNEWYWRAWCWLIWKMCSKIWWCEQVISFKLEPVCCKKRQKIVPDQLLVWGIRALWRFWMVPNWS